MRRVGCKFNLVFAVELVKKSRLVVALRITDQRKKCISVQNIISAGNDSSARSDLRFGLNEVSLVNKLDGRPHCDGWKRVENFLNSFVHLSYVLDSQAGVVDLQGSGQICLTEISESSPLEVEIFQRPLQCCQASRLGRRDRKSSEIVDFVSDVLLLKSRRIVVWNGSVGVAS
jgi:hypothetical protein